MGHILEPAPAAAGSFVQWKDRWLLPTRSRFEPERTHETESHSTVHTVAEGTVHPLGYGRSHTPVAQGAALFRNEGSLGSIPRIGSVT